MLAITIATVVLILLGLWRRDALLTEAAEARRDRTTALTSLTTLRTRIRNTVLASRSLEADNAATLDAAKDLERTLDDVAVKIQVTEQERDDTAVSAYIAGGQLGQLRECLDGITRALNQVAVGDPNSISTLEAAGPACRAVGV